MKTTLNRKDFLRLSAVGAFALYFQNCKQQLESKQPESKNPLVSAPKGLPDETSNKHVQYFVKGTPDYEQLRQGFNRRVQKYPAVIAQCFDTQGVADAVRYADKNSLAVAVKSGGHCFEGFSSNNGGLVVNCSSMDSVEWLDATTVRIGAGCKLGTVYAELFSKNRIIPAGSCAGVGVAGLTLGGGYGLFSRKLGLTCDSLRSVTMVDGKGNIHQAKENDDVLWACRGGGNGNFGVITHLTFSTHVAPESLTAHRFKSKGLNAEQATSILAQWFDITKQLPDSCFSAFVLNGKSLLILLTNTEPDNSEVRQAIQQLTAITTTTSLGKPKPPVTAITTFYGRTESLYFKNASAGLYRDFTDIQAFIRQVLEIVTTTPGMIYQVNTLGGMINDSDFAQASAYPHRTYPYLSELQTYWEKESQTEHYTHAFGNVQQIFSSNGISTQYRNYPDINFSDWQHTYYQENYTRLQAIKQQYDPHNIIRHEQSVSLSTS